MEQEDYKKILSILEQTFECNITAPRPVLADLSFTVDQNVDDLAVVKSFISNQHILTSEYVNNLIADQLSTYTINFMPTSFADYSAKVADMLAAVKYRSEAGFEYQNILPTQQELFALQHACCELTGDYGHFYVHYIEMCQEAGITRYKYNELGRCTASDKFISQIDVKQRMQMSEKYLTNILQPYLDQGGLVAHGRTDIDATSICNIFYYTNARQIFYHQVAKQLIVETKNIADYGQLPQAKRVSLWQAIQQAFPGDRPQDKDSIFYKFIKYINETPGEFFAHFSAELPELAKLTVEQIHHVLQAAGLYCKKLVLVSRGVAENWHPKRFLNLQWQRKFPLDIVLENKQQSLRHAGDLEQVRIWPNELPYCTGHGLSICGNGLIEGSREYGTFAYEWNIPQDATAEINNYPRDVEKLFREAKLLNNKDYPIGLFQNLITYSSIQKTQHAHIHLGTLEAWPTYLLPASRSIEIIGAKLEFVSVGDNIDSMYLRAIFDVLDNELLIKYFIDLNMAILKYFNGAEYVDAQMHIARSAEDKYVFIYEPHARLYMQQNGKFLNPDNNEEVLPKPQYFVPKDLPMSICCDDYVRGREYMRDFFDKTCKPGVLQVILDFTNQFQQSHR